MKKHVIKVAVLLTVLSILFPLLNACAAGVSQEDLDAVQQQLTAKEKEITALKEQLKDENVLLSAVPNAPPRPPRPAPKPGDPPPPPPPTPPTHEVVPLYFYVDTVTAGGGESQYNVDASRYCAITSTFKRGMHIVWRMEAVDTSTGMILQAADVKSAVLNLPGETKDFHFGRHGASDDAPWFWTAAWDVPPDFPLGILDFNVVVTTNDGKTGTFRQIPVNMLERNIISSLNIVE
jgi:hypothetical protein